MTTRPTAFPYRDRRAWQREYDVRHHAELLAALLEPPEDGHLTLLVATRRAGKTWTLRALADGLATTHGVARDRVRYVDVHRDGVPEGAFDGGYLLLDEAGSSLQREDTAQAFVQRLVALSRGGARMLLALTPRELDQLRGGDPRQHVCSAKSVRYLAPPTRAEVERLAGRTAAATRWLPDVPWRWRTSLCLLELLLSIYERDTTRAHDDVLAEALRTARNTDHAHEHHVFRDGLTDALCDALSAVARGESIAPVTLETLTALGLVALDPSSRHPCVADPVLAPRLTPLRIHHLSDIHVGPKSASDTDVKADPSSHEQLAAGAGPRMVRDAYLTELQGQVARGEGPHLVVVSGDLVEWATSKQYAEFTAWFVQVRAAVAANPHPVLGAGDPRVLLVGGNHDVSWTAALPTDPPNARHQTFADTFRDDPHPHLEVNAEARDLAQSAVLLREAGVAFLLLGSAEVGGEVTVDPTRRALLKILDDVPAGALDAAQQTEANALRTAVHADPIRDRLATLLRGVSALDKKTRGEVDTLRDAVERIDPGMVHQRVLDAVKKFRWPESTPVRIAVLHHPVSPLPVTEVAAFAGLVNAGRVKSTLMDAGFTLVLHGHAHRGWFSVERWPTAHGDRTLHIAAAPSLSSHEVSEKHGYNEIVVTPPLAHGAGDDGAVHVVVRRRVHDGGNWALDGASLEFTVPERVARAT